METTAKILFAYVKCVHVSVRYLSTHTLLQSLFILVCKEFLVWGKYSNSKPNNNITPEGMLLFGLVQIAFRNITFRHSPVKTNLLAELFHFSLAKDHKEIKLLFFQVHSGLLGFPDCSPEETSFMQIYLPDPCS